MRVIFLILIGFSILNAEFIRSNGMVTDTETGYVWQDNELSDDMTWIEAIDYCEALTLGNENDWRLPNKKELLSLVSSESLTISSEFQFNSNNWSSTTFVGSPDEAWFVYAGDNYISAHTVSKTKTAVYKPATHVRCVRGR